MRFPKWRAAIALFVGFATLAATPSLPERPRRSRPRFSPTVPAWTRICASCAMRSGVRATGSMAYGAALEWGLQAFRRAKVDSVALEGPTTRRRSGRASARRRRSLVAGPVSAARRVVRERSLHRREAEGAPRRRRKWRQRRVRKARAQGARSNRPRADEADAVLRRPLRRVPGGAGDARGGGGGCGRGRDPLHVHPPAGPPVPPHGHVGRTLVSIPMARFRARTGLRLARLLDARNTGWSARDLKNRIGGPWRRKTSSRRSADPRSPRRSFSSARTWTRGTSGRARSTTASTARSSSRWPARSPRARGRGGPCDSFCSRGRRSGSLGSRGYVAAHRASWTGTPPS